jgi:ammonium transporter, Amt family
MAVDAGDTAFMMVSSALVMLMTVGLAFFYGGLVRRKNVLAIMMQSFAAFGVVTAVWVLVGYSFAFGEDRGGLIGSFQYAGLANVAGDPHPRYGTTIPALVFMAFQLMFAIITPALITGAFADRMRFSRYIVFIGIWSLVVYVPLAHWIWGGGFLGQNGVIDFAGGYVVHMSAGFSALASVFVFRPRSIPSGESPSPHNVPYVALGAGLLWFGWFGFNAGSALTAGALAAYAFVNTMLGGAFALLTWMGVNWWNDGKPSATGALTGSIAGLAAVTPASGFVAPWAAVIIGILAGAGCYGATKLRARRRWDDSLDVFACHGIGGTIGVIATGALAAPWVNGQSGLVYGGAELFLKQAGAALLVAAFSFGVTLVILKAMQRAGGIQVSEPTEQGGLDRGEHGEAAYD